MCDKGALVDTTSDMSQLCTVVAKKLLGSDVALMETEHLTAAGVRRAVVHVKQTTP